MNINLEECMNILHDAREKINQDFFPSFSQKSPNLLVDSNISKHAGALCLYSALLVSKKYETAPETIAIMSNEREQLLQDELRNNPKYANWSEGQIAEKASAMILKDIRNSFAHGNFKINISKQNGNVSFVLYPQRKDTEIDAPIVISQEAIKESIMAPIFNQSFNLWFMNKYELESKVAGDFNGLLKSMMIPTQMLQLADFYLGGRPIPNSKIDTFAKRAPIIQYILLATQITYEQDDYYNIFGKDSQIFNIISLIRNSLAHDGVNFGVMARDIHYVDRNRQLDETLDKSVVKLLSANAFKEIIMGIDKDKHSEYAIDDLKNKLIECFDEFVINTPYEKDLL